MGEKVFRTDGNEFIVQNGVRPSETNQLYDELLQKERELGAAIRFQRDIEGRYL